MFPQRLEERRAWLRRGFSSAVDCAVDQKAHLFLQAGDLFDTPEPRNVERQFVAESLAALRAAGVRPLAIGGNHDTPRARGGSAPATPQGTYARLGGLRLLGDAVSRRVGEWERERGREGESEGGREDAQSSVLSPQSWTHHSSLITHHSIDTELLEIEGFRVAVGGIAPDPRLRAGADPLEGLEWRPEADVSILLVHGSLQGHVYPGAPEPVISRESVERMGVDCLVVGHVHKFASFRWGRTTVVVPGGTERMTFGEEASLPGFVYLEMEPGRPVAVRHMPVEPQPRYQVVLRSEDLDEEDPAQTVLNHLEESCTREALVKMKLEGPITRKRYHDLRIRELADYGAARCFFLDLDTTGLYVEDDLPRFALRTGRLSPREELIRYGGEVAGVAGSRAERALIDEAMDAILSEYE